MISSVYGTSNIQKRIDVKILDLATKPRREGVQKLKYDENFYHIRVGDYSVIYEINVPKYYFVILSNANGDGNLPTAINACRSIIRSLLLKSKMRTVTSPMSVCG